MTWARDRNAIVNVFSLPIGLMVIIFGISSIPGQIDSERLKFITELDPKLQNLLHVPLFGLLQILWLSAMAKTGRSGTKAMLSCCGICLGYGVFDEFHQMFVLGRYASVTDMALNLVGVTGATLLVFLWRRYSAL